MNTYDFVPVEYLREKCAVQQFVVADEKQQWASEASPLLWGALTTGTMRMLADKEINSLTVVRIFHGQPEIIGTMTREADKISSVIWTNAKQTRQAA